MSCGKRQVQCTYASGAPDISGGKDKSSSSKGALGAVAAIMTSEVRHLHTRNVCQRFVVHAGCSVHATAKALSCEFSSACQTPHEPRIEVPQKPP